MDWHLFRRRDSNLWLVEWHQDGQRREACLETDDEQLAEQRAGELVASIAPAHPQADRAPQAQYCVAHALEDLFLRGLSDNADGTKQCYRQRAGHLLRVLGERPLASLHLDHVQDYVDQRLREEAASESVRKELCVLRRALDLALRRGAAGPKLDAVFPRFRSKYVPKKTWLTRAQVDALLAELDAPKRRIFVLAALYTGARLSELLRLTWEDILFSEARIRIRGKKGRKDAADRFIPLHSRLAVALLDVRRPAGRVLDPWTNVRRDLALACKHAGVPNSTPNDLRRTFASWLVQAGVPSYQVGVLLGHTSSVMVEKVYGRLTFQALEAAVSKID